MKLQQLRYLNEVVRQGFNVSAAAEALFTSQPGVSKQIRLLEEELGVEVFVRNGKRLTDMTQPGREVVSAVRRVLREMENLRQVGLEFTNRDSGLLTIATTHTQARYALPPVVRRFTQRYPKVRLSLRQGNPTQIAKWVACGEADIAIATEAIEAADELVTLPCYQWTHCIVAGTGHALLDDPVLTLEKVATYPIVTYDFAFSGRSKINHAFETRGLAPNVVLTALDADIIKTYVELGLGIGIMAKMAFDPERDLSLRMLDASHLFESSTTRIGVQQGAYLRGYAYDFIELFAPHLSRKVVDAAMGGKRGTDFVL
jgi:LysR family cys regulon transcriptional activator